jgi:transposase InsO family protein
MLKEIGKTIKILIYDRGIEFYNKMFQNFLDKKNIKHELTCVYTPKQNGVVEKDNRMILESTRSMIHWSNVHPKFWGGATHTVMYLFNCIGNQMLVDSMTPYQMKYKVKLSIIDVQIFGSSAYVQILKNLKGSWHY